MNAFVKSVLARTNDTVSAKVGPRKNRTSLLAMGLSAVVLAMTSFSTLAADTKVQRTGTITVIEEMSGEVAPLSVRNGERNKYAPANTKINASLVHKSSSSDTGRVAGTDQPQLALQLPSTARAER